MGCSKLSRLDIANNPWEDKKLAKLADSQQEQAPAKPVLELLRKGQSRRQLKSELGRNIAHSRPPPPRLYRPRDLLGEAGAPVAAEAEVSTPATKSGKKG